MQKDTFDFIPILDMRKEWTNENLYKGYGLTEYEIAFIEQEVRPME